MSNQRRIDPTFSERWNSHGIAEIGDTIWLKTQHCVPGNVPMQPSHKNLDFSMRLGTKPLRGGKEIGMELWISDLGTMSCILVSIVPRKRLNLHIRIRCHFSPKILKQQSVPFKERDESSLEEELFKVGRLNAWANEPSTAMDTTFDMFDEPIEAFLTLHIR